VLANLVGGVLVVYAVGVPVQARILAIPFEAALVAAWVFLPGDVIKAVVAAVVARAVHRGYPLLDRPRRDGAQADGGQADGGQADGERAAPRSA
jgi:biotin transport system substrate-specific component